MLAASMSVEATNRLHELIHHEDGRVSVVACNTILERAFGKPKEHDPSEDKPQIKVDFSSMSLEERKQLLGLVRRTVTVEESAVMAEPDAPDPPLIESQAEPDPALSASSEVPEASPLPRVGRLKLF